MDEQQTPTAPKAKRKTMRIPNPTGKNQWSKLQTIADPEEREEQLDSWRERFKSAKLIERLVKHGDGTVDLKPTQVKALEIVLDRLEPRLSAVEQTQADPLDGMSPQQLLEQLAPILRQHPEWLRTIGFVPLAPTDAAHTPPQVLDDTGT